MSVTLTDEEAGAIVAAMGLRDDVRRAVAQLPGTLRGALRKLSGPLTPPPPPARVGDVVLYTPYGAEAALGPLASLVVGWGYSGGKGCAPAADLRVFMPDGSDRFHVGVPHDPSGSPRSWRHREG